MVQKHLVPAGPSGVRGTQAAHSQWQQGLAACRLTETVVTSWALPEPVLVLAVHSCNCAG